VKDEQSASLAKDDLSGASRVLSCGARSRGIHGQSVPGQLIDEHCCDRFGGHQSHADRGELTLPALV
jgi:hypothetical protein